MIALDSESVEQIAQRVAELLRDEPDRPLTGTWITASEVARRFGVDRSWVYENAGRLGARQLGDGPRPRLRFDPALVFDRLSARPAPASTPPRTPPRRQRSKSAELLPVKGRS